MAATMLDTVPTELPPAPGTPDASSVSEASSPTAVTATSEEAEERLGDALEAAAEAVVAADKKKRKKRKKKSNNGGVDDAELAEAERKIGPGDDVSAWRARASARLDRLRSLKSETDSLRRELGDAHDRATDAERAERLVNTGLRNAHALLADRDKALASSGASNASLTAEVATLTEEKRKNEKRLALLKTVSEKLQEARDARDAAERRADEASSSVAALKKTTASLEKDLQGQADKVQQVKKELEDMVVLHAEATAEANEEAKIAVRNAHVVAAAVAGAAGLLVGVLMSGLKGKSRDD